MKWITGKNKKLIIGIIIAVVIIAGLLDIILKGLLHQLLSSLIKV